MNWRRPDIFTLLFRVIRFIRRSAGLVSKQFAWEESGTVGAMVPAHDLLDHSTLGNRRSYQCMSDGHSMDE